MPDHEAIRSESPPGQLGDCRSLDCCAHAPTMQECDDFRKLMFDSSPRLADILEEQPQIARLCAKAWMEAAERSLAASRLKHAEYHARGALEASKFAGPAHSYELQSSALPQAQFLLSRVVRKRGGTHSLSEGVGLLKEAAAEGHAFALCDLMQLVLEEPIWDEVDLPCPTAGSSGSSARARASSTGAAGCRRRCCW